jgi:hypothetical protein
MPAHHDPNEPILMAERIVILERGAVAGRTDGTSPQANKHDTDPSETCDYAGLRPRKTAPIRAATIRAATIRAATVRERSG